MPSHPGRFRPQRRKMKTLNPYLTFAGNCREAMNFYRDCLNGEITQIQTFEEAKFEVDEKLKGHIIHAELRADSVFIMASDGMADFASRPGNNVSLSIDLSDEKKKKASSMPWRTAGR